ncbi:chromodomain-helicase-DNA-binding protein 5-like isoform X2 [Hydractinia symbiolongicarpus]|uniref:chromodomain-helicase-DNA-binding protein 5-like isoform X2 n=1 Tax=Hydractinia symbiolongicarpus TaxID=13093 RepID=UPI002551712A|nr:chromodomain-helicase-DNA-binding protein 5-like isoform X2 [Hydractinia symbiolongicarpus]
MPPKKEYKRLDLLESDTDSDYSPKTITTAKRKKQSRGMESPSASDTDSGRKKRKRNNQDADFDEEEPLTYSDHICQTHGLNNVDIEIPDECLSDINYKQFNKLVRPIVAEANPKVSGLHVTSLVGAKWREFKELYGINARSETPDVDRGKNIGRSPSFEFEKESMPASPDSLNIQESGEGSEDDDFLDDESSNDLKLKMIRRGNKIFRAGDRKTSRQSKKTPRQGIVNFDDINLDDVTREEADESSQETLRKKPGPKKRTGPRIKNTKDKKEKKKAKTIPTIGKRGPYKKGKKGEPVPEPIHNSVCDVCGEGGDILLCDTCTCSWHLTCLDPPLDEVPEGLWSCPKCEAEMTGQVEEEEEDDTFHGEYCKICKDGGELLCCDYCPGTYHMRCVKPQLISVPDGEWRCPMCKVEPLPEKVERILFWKFLTHHPTEEEIAAGAKNESYKVRKFFVKYANLSYWKCHWIDELQLEKYHVSLYRFFCRKNDMNDAPMTEEGLVEGGEDTNVDEVEHQRNLDQRFYQYGIKPDWLQIHRILWHRELKKSKGTQYLVKWKEIGYDYATWEYKDDEDNKDVVDFDKAIESYNKLRSKYKKKTKLKGKDKTSKRKDGWEYDVRPNGYNADDQPKFITDTGGKLHEYQIEGINWIRYSWGQHDNTILADEMGLGKTIQTITFLNSLWKEGRSEGPFLICAPLSTLVNWEREFEFWAPEMYVVSYSGHRENRQVIRNYEMTFDEDALKKGTKAYKVKKDSAVKFHVLLTSYELVSIDANTLQSIDWKVLVIDEAHRLKNNQSKFFRTMSNYNIGYTLLLTGTPLQNNLEELFHLLNFLCPNKFINRENFLAEFEDIGKEDQIKKLHEMLGPHMLRRLKSDVLKGIPTKSEFIVRIELSPMQQKYYKYILTKNFEALNARGSVQVSLLNIVMELKKCCNHPYLFATAASEAPRLPNNAFEVKALTEASGKLVLLYKMLKKLETQGHRVLIFSQMTRVLDLLEDFMEGHAWRYERLDGTITGQIRQAAIDRFNQPNSGIFAFLLSTRAGGLGINLATADTVFIFDSDWNPHNDIQAFSRAHRIGQQNKVMIYRFVTKGSVEERITQVAKKKMMLTHLVVRPGLGSKAAQAMSKRELDDILKFGTEQMFKDAADDTGRIVYDDKAVEALLDRSNEGIQEKESGGMDEYLSSFKVANYTVKDKDEPDVEVLKQDADVIDTDYWEKLLRHHYEQEQEYIASTLGKGKRVRKQVNYNDGALTAETNKILRGDFDASELVDDSDDLSDEEGSNLTVRQKKYRDRDVLPPLLAKVGSQIEVYGFNPRQRRAFLTAVMRYGLPPKSFKTAKDKWCIHNLRGKTEKAFQAYTSMFLRHLCEPGMDSKQETYSDGVPREGVNRLQVLSRIGIMSLVRRKVEEYSSVNTFLHQVLIGHITLQSRSMSKLIEEIKHANELNPVKTDTVNVASPKEVKKEEQKNEKDCDDGKKKEDKPTEVVQSDNTTAEKVVDNKTPEKVTEEGVTEDKAKESSQSSATEEEKMDVDETAKEKVNDDVAMENETPSTKNGDDIKELTDSNLTNGDAKDTAMEIAGDSNDVSKTENDAHKGTNGVIAQSDASADALSKDAKTSDIGVDATPTCDVTKEAGKNEVEKSLSVEKPKEVKLEPRVIDGVTLPKFMFNIADGGFTELHVLWEAEEKRKLDNIWWRYHDYWLLAGVVVHGYGRWQDIQNDVRFETINKPFARMSLDYKNKFIARRFKLLEQALIVEEQLKRATLMRVQQENPHPAMSLQSRFAELECLAESHQHLSKESLAGNKPANAVLHKVLNQLETLLSDMKNDVNRLPTALAKMPPVTHRLNMSERAVLTRLATGGQMPNAVNAPTAAASLHSAALSNPPPQGVTLLPVKGPVISPPSARPAVDSTRSLVLATRPNDV